MNGMTSIDSSKTWTSHPLREEPLAKSVLLVLIILGVAFIVGVSFQSITFALLSLALLTAAMSRYFFSTRYVLEAHGFTISHIGTRRQYLWTNFRRAARHPDGVFLSPFAKPHRLDTFRGQFLRSKNPTEIYRVVQKHIAIDPA